MTSFTKDQRENTGKEFTKQKLAWLEQVAKDARLTKTSIRVATLIALCYFNRKKGCAWPSQKRLAQDLSASHTGVRNAITGLAEHGHLEVRRGGWGKNSRYRWIIKPEEEKTTDRQKTDNQGQYPERQKTNNQDKCENILDRQFSDTLSASSLAPNPLSEPFDADRDASSVSIRDTQMGSLNFTGEEDSFVATEEDDRHPEGARHTSAAQMPTCHPSDLTFSNWWDEFPPAWLLDLHFSEEDEDEEKRRAYEAWVGLPDCPDVRQTVWTQTQAFGKYVAKCVKEGTDRGSFHSPAEFLHERLWEEPNHWTFEPGYQISFDQSGGEDDV